MKILLSGFGNIPPRYLALLSYCENYIDHDTGGHEIVTFGYNKGTDITISPEDDISKVIDLLHDSWRPDICMLWGIEFNLLPKGIEDAPFPTVAVIFDPDYDLPLVRAIVQSCDLSITVGEHEREILAALGANDTALFYYQGLMREHFNPAPPPVRGRRYDVLYTTFIDDERHPDRSRWVHKLSALSDKYNICITPPVPNYNDYIDLLQDSKLVLSHHRYGSMSLRILEAASQGTVTLETGSDVKRYFVADEEFIPVTEETLAHQVERHLHDIDGLEEISRKVYIKVIHQFEARERFLGLVDFISERLKADRGSRRGISEGEKHLRRGEVYYHSFFRNVKGRFVQEFGRFLQLSVNEFRMALSSENTPRAVTALATALTTYGFYYERDATIEEGWKEVAALLKQVTQSSPSYALAHYNLGLIYMRVNNFTEASEAFESALALFDRSESEVDPWCMFPRCYDGFKLWKPLTVSRIELSKGNREGEERIRNLYRAGAHYYIHLMKKERGDVFNAIENLVNAHRCYPDSAMLMKESAALLTALGMKEDGLAMYRACVEFLPLDIDIETEYIGLLYLYRHDREAFREIKKALNIAKSVRKLRGKISELKDKVDDFNRYSASGYSHDTFVYTILNEWIATLYGFLKKSPGNLRLLLRIAALWKELGRRDKMLEIVEDYVTKHMAGVHLSDDDLASLRGLCSYLHRSCDGPGRLYMRRIERMEALLSTSQRTSSAVG